MNAPENEGKDRIYFVKYYAKYFVEYYALTCHEVLNAVVAELGIHKVND